MKDLILFLAKALVDNPDGVELTVTPAVDHSLYELKVAPGDVGKVIGRDGRTINALRTVVQHAAQRKGEKVRLELADDRPGFAVSPGIVKVWLGVGYVSRAHGLRGSLVVRTFDAASTALGEVGRVQLTPRKGDPSEHEVVDVREGPAGDLLLALKGVTNRSSAEALVGATVAVHRDELEAPSAGEFFQGDLVGLRAVTPGGRSLGVVQEVWSSGPVPNLVLRDGEREEMVPFAEEFVRRVDLAAGVVVIEPPRYEEP